MILFITVKRNNYKVQKYIEMVKNNKFKDTIALLKL